MLLTYAITQLLAARRVADHAHAGVRAERVESPRQLKAMTSKPSTSEVHVYRVAESVVRSAERSSD